VLPGSSGSQAARAEIGAAVGRVQSAIETAERATALRAQHLSVAGEEGRQQFFDETLAAAQTAWANPPVALAVTPIGATEQAPAGDSNAYAQSSPAMMAQFAIAGLMGAAEIMVLERKSRALHRLLTTTVSRGEILLGHFLAMFILILAQLLLLMGFGQLILDLPYFAEPGASLLLAVATALFAAALGLLIGVLARKEEQVIVFSLIPMFVLAALGGAWLPLELMPVSFQRFAIWTPLARVVEGFKDVLVRGRGVEAVLPGVGLLAAYALVCLALVAMRFRSEAR
jgi:ABC-2 type transport system permease protein